jgi:hypothetical protein
MNTLKGNAMSKVNTPSAANSAATASPFTHADQRDQRNLREIRRLQAERLAQISPPAPQFYLDSGSSPLHAWQPKRVGNQRAIAALQALLKEARAMDAAGFDIVSAEIPEAGKAILQLAGSARTQRLVEEGVAVYYMRGYSATLGHYRRGQILNRACNVCWFDRGAV